MKIKRERVFIASLAVIVIAVVVVLNFTISGKNVQNNNQPPISITYENIAQVLSSSTMIQDLPGNSVILLKFYNFNSGERQWEKSYILKNIGVVEGYAENPDLTIIIHSKYLTGLTTGNFCSMINIAKKNGDLGTESSLSAPALLWKFKSMTEYRECLGF